MKSKLTLLSAFAVIAVLSLVAIADGPSAAPPPTQSAPATPNGGNEFSSGSPEFDSNTPPEYTDSEIQKKIQDEMAVSCKNNMCEIVGSDSSGSSFTVSFNVGYGTQNPNGVGGGTTPTGGTGVVIVGTDGVIGSQTPGYWAGITVTYKTYTCQSHLEVTPAIYRFVNTYLYDMVNADGSVKRNFSPADQTVVLFYTTMLNKVDDCKASF